MNISRISGHPTHVRHVTADTFWLWVNFNISWASGQLCQYGQVTFNIYRALAQRISFDNHCVWGRQAPLIWWEFQPPKKIFRPPPLRRTPSPCAHPGNPHPSTFDTPNHPPQLPRAPPPCPPPRIRKHCIAILAP